MPAKEISLQQLKITGEAGTVVARSLTKNKDYDGSARGVPAGVRGEAALNEVKVLSSEKPEETWIMINTTAVVIGPSEYRGRKVYPGFMYGQSTLADPEKADDTVRGIIRFLSNLGIADSQIAAVKAAKPADFIYTAVKTIEANCGKTPARFKFSTVQNKKQENRVNCYANGAVEAAAGAPVPPVPQPETASGIPNLDEIWGHQNIECRVLACDPTDGNETVTLQPLDGSAPFENLPWFDAEGNQQITYIRGR